MCGDDGEGGGGEGFEVTVARKKSVASYTFINYDFVQNKHMKDLDSSRYRVCIGIARNIIHAVVMCAVVCVSIRKNHSLWF